MSDWSESRCQAAVNGLAAEAERLFTAEAEAYWNATMSGQAADEERLAAIKAEVLRFFSDQATFADLKSMRAAGQVQDPLLARQLEGLYRGFLGNQLTPEEIAERVRLETELDSLFTNHRARVAGQELDDNEIRQVLRGSGDQDLRRAAWEGSKQVGALAAPKVTELARLRNRIARRLGFRDYYALALWLQEIDEDQLFAVLDRLRDLTAAPFAGVKAEVDAELAARFGVAPADLMPWHYSDPFFQEAPAGEELDMDRFFAGKDLVTMVRQFYSSIGLDVDPILARSDLYPRPGKHQHAYCTDINRRGDVRICCNLAPSEYWAGTLLHELGHAVYDLYHDRALPYLLREPAHTLTTEAVAMLMGRLSKDPRWLTEIAAVEGAEARAAGAALHRQLTRYMLVFVRWALVMVHFERELYRDPEQDLAAVWWRLVRELQGLQIPPGRPAPDWGAKVHISTHPVYYHNYILGELTASQLAAALERDTGQPGLVGNPAAGRWLIQRVFRPGNRHPWDELIRLATGEPLDPRHFVSQFVERP